MFDSSRSLSGLTLCMQFFIDEDLHSKCSILSSMLDLPRKTHLKREREREVCVCVRVCVCVSEKDER